MGLTRCYKTRVFLHLSPYISNSLTSHHEAWQYDAYWLSEPYRLLKFQISEKSRRQMAVILKTIKQSYCSNHSTDRHKISIVMHTAPIIRLDMPAHTQHSLFCPIKRQKWKTKLAYVSFVVKASHHFITATINILSTNSFITDWQLMYMW